VHNDIYIREGKEGIFSFEKSRRIQDEILRQCTFIFIYLISRNFRDNLFSRSFFFTFRGYLFSRFSDIYVFPGVIFLRLKGIFVYFVLFYGDSGEVF
jgi:hypothetical protein